MRLLGTIFLFLACISMHYALANERWTIRGHAQGTTYKIIYYAAEAHVSKMEIDSILDVIDQSMSLYRSSSLISTFNHPAQSHIHMDRHMAKVVDRSFEIHLLSDGVFDITIKPLVDLWGFGEREGDAIPDSLAITNLMKRVSQQKYLRLHGNILSKEQDGVSIDLNGIAQGYTVDVLANHLSERGIANFLVELGGEIITKGAKPDGNTFKVAIGRPPNDLQAVEYIVSLKDKAITTAGSYERQRTVNDQLASHHINPKTGYPFVSNVVSVTVLTDRAIDADAWDNVFMGMDVKTAIKLANKLKKVEIYAIYREGDTYKELFSDGFKKYLDDYK